MGLCCHLGENVEPQDFPIFVFKAIIQILKLIMYIRHRKTQGGTKFYTSNGFIPLGRFSRSYFFLGSPTGMGWFRLGVSTVKVVVACTSHRWPCKRTPGCSWQNSGGMGTKVKSLGVHLHGLDLQYFPARIGWFLIRGC